MALFQHCVVGGGIVGLAVAAKLSHFGPTLLLEKNSLLLHETSSRNSCVLHAGIYYPEGTLKAALSVEGNRIIRHLIQHETAPVDGRICGKWIGSVNEQEDAVLEDLAKLMKKRSIPFEMVSAEKARELEPRVEFRTILHSLNTGILDVHSLAGYYQKIIDKNKFLSRGQGAKSDSANVVQTNSQVLKIQPRGNGGFTIETSDGAALDVEYVVNCGGLWSNDVTKMVMGTVPEDETQYYCRGRYVKYSTGKPIFSRLVYPCPLPNLKGLGVHATIDLIGSVRFGPDTQYTDSRTDYRVSDDKEFIDGMYNAIQRYVPSIEREKLQVEFCGIRPKLSREGEGFRDFLIRRETAFGFPNFVSLAGIESPGLTASPAIADYVTHTLLEYPRVPWELVGPEP